jgi:hypothetical protein
MDDDAFLFLDDTVLVLTETGGHRWIKPSTKIDERMMRTAVEESISHKRIARADKATEDDVVVNLCLIMLFCRKINFSLFTTKIDSLAA